MTSNHNCNKEAEIAEIKQLVKSLSSNEEKVLRNWHDVRMLEEKQELYKNQLQELQQIYNEQHKETLEIIREINECQNKLIQETVKTNTTFNNLKWVVGLVMPVICTVLAFIITEFFKSL